MHAQALEELFVQELEELYDAEKHIGKGLSLLARSARNPDLKAAFQAHQKETGSRVERLKKCFASLGEKPRRGRASGVAGLIRQTREFTKQHDFDHAVIDAGLLSSAEKLQKYQLVAYGCLRTHAGLLGYRAIEDLISESIKKEEDADALLASIEANGINRDAAAAPYALARTGPRHDKNGMLDSAPVNGGKAGLRTIVLGLAVGGLLTILFRPARPGAR